MKPKPLKLYIVKKYVWATSALTAIKKESKLPVDDCWVDDCWKKQQELNANEIGFKKNKRKS
jgi:hypothetical protein